MAKDSQFESVFADLAFSQLRERAASLLPYALGFQVLDKSDDDNKGVGVFGFKAGDQILFVPLFFINGELKGYELLYLKNQDLFIPLQDNWINHILNKKPIVLGEGTDKSLSEIGVTAPNFLNFVHKPNTKYASWVVENQNSIANMFCKTLKSAEYTTTVDRLRLPEFIKNNGLETVSVLFKEMSKNAAFANQILNFYNLEELKVNPKTFSKTAKDTTIKVKVITPETINEVGDITDAEKEEVLIEGASIRDTRPESQKSKLYVTDLGKNLTNPTTTGLYRMLNNDATYSDILYVAAPITIGQGSANCGLVVDLKTKKADCFDSKGIFVSETSSNNLNKKALTDYFDKGESVTELNAGDFGFILANNGKATLPFQVIQKATESDGTCNYYVATVRHVQNLNYRTTGPAYATSKKDQAKITYFGNPDEFQAIETKLTQSEKDTLYSNNLGSWGNIKRLSINPQQTNNDFVAVGNTLITNVKNKVFIKLANKNGSMDMLHPGNILDVEFAVFKTAQFDWCKVYSNGHEFQIKYKLGNTPFLTKNAAWKFLVNGLGVDAKEALSLLKTASDSTPNNYRIKYADEYPGAYGAGIPTTSRQESLENVSIQPPSGLTDTDMHQVMQAAQTGQRDVFDTSVVGSLVKTVDSASLIDRYMKDLIRGLDRIGRILFLFYWHNNQLRERYGDEEMPDLEDSLKNTFKSFGDLVLFLKQKDIQPINTDSNTNVDLGLVI